VGDLPEFIPPGASEPQESTEQPAEVRNLSEAQPVSETGDVNSALNVSEAQSAKQLSVTPTPEEQIQLDALADAERRQFLTRLRWLFAVGVFSFAFVSWMLVRTTRNLQYGVRGSDPDAVIRVEVGSLANGDLEAGYAQLSERYRKQVSFEDYHALVAMHRRMFLTREYRVTRRDTFNGRTFIDAQMTSSDGHRFLARFTLIQEAGRWWIDDLHWGADSDKDSRRT
jgi:hypothetical protein